MPRKIHTEMFIQTLEEMLDHERQRRKARLRLQIKAHVKRFVEEFGTDLDGSRRASKSIPQGQRSSEHSVSQIRAD